MATNNKTVLDSRVPSGSLEEKWENHKFSMNLVNPNNKRKFDVIVVGTGLAGASAAASLGELGYKVKAFTLYPSSPKEAAADAPAKPVPTTITSNFLLLFGFTNFIENLWFSHFSSNEPEGTRESSTVLLLLPMI